MCAAAANLPVPEGCPPAPESIADAWRADAPTRTRICLNGLWRARPVPLDGDAIPAGDALAPPPDGDWGWARVPARIEGFPVRKDAVDDNPIRVAPEVATSVPADQKDALWPRWYRRTFEMPREAAGRRVILACDDLRLRGDVFVDGEPAGAMTWPESELDITALARPGREQTLAILVTWPMPKDWSSNWQEWFMGTDDPSMMGKVKRKARAESKGFCGDVWLDLVPKGPRATFAWGELMLPRGGASGTPEAQQPTSGGPAFREYTAAPCDAPTVAFTVETEGLDAGAKYAIEVTATPKWGGKAAAFRSGPIAPDGRGLLRFSAPWPDVALWDPDAPQHLYDVSMRLLDAKGRALDDVLPFETGFREVRLAGRDVLLNGRPVHFWTTDFTDSWRQSNGCLGGALAFCRRALGMGFNAAAFTGHFSVKQAWQEDIYRAADRTGLLVLSGYAPDNADAPISAYMLATNDAMKAIYRDRCERAARAIRRHPAAVIYKLNWNRAGWGEWHFPRGEFGLAHNGRLPEDWMEQGKRNASCLWAAEAMNEADPTRPALTHSSATLGNFTTGNLYLGWMPPQERADYMEGWARTGTLPVNFVEFGMPDCSRFQSFRRPYFIYDRKSTYWQRQQVAENVAEFFGEEAFRDDDKTRAAMKREDAHFAGPPRPYIQGGNQGAVDGQKRQGARVMGLFWSEQLKAFRAQGVNGALPWAWNYLWNYKSWPGRHRNAGAWKGLKEPGMTAEWISGEHLYGSQYPDSAMAVFGNKDMAEFMQLTDYGLAMQRWGAPAVGWVGGGESEGSFTAKRRNYAAGEAVEKRLVLVSDRMKPVECRWTWKVKDGAGASGTTVVPPGRRVDVPISFAAPEAPGEYEIEATFEFADGSAPQSDSFAFNALPAPKPFKGSRTISLYDPVGLTARELDRLGIPYADVTRAVDERMAALTPVRGARGRAEGGAGGGCVPGADDAAVVPNSEPWSGSAGATSATSASPWGGAQTLVIGRESLVRALWDREVVPRAVKGKDVVVFEQRKEDLEDIGFRVQERGMRQGWARFKDRALAAALSDGVLRDWAGSSTLVDPDWWAKAREPHRDRLGRATQMWAGYAMTRILRVNDRGCIASVVPEKPQVGDWRALVDGLFGLESAPLLQMRTGSGSVTLCQLDVTARTVADPAADRIVAALLDHKHGGLATGRPEFLGADAVRAGFAWGVKSWANDKDLVVSPGAKIPEDLEARVANGATVLCLGMGAEEARAWSCGEELPIAETNECYFARIEQPPKELNGLSNADFFWHGAMDFAAFQDENPEGNAAFRVVRHGKGRVVYWQLPPWRFDLDKRPHQRSSRRAASRMFARLFCNLGWETFTDGTGYHKRPQYKDVPEADDDPYDWVNL